MDALSLAEGANSDEPRSVATTKVAATSRSFAIYRVIGGGLRSQDLGVNIV